MLRKSLLPLLCFGMTCCVGLAGSNDDYFRLARLSYIDGHVSFQHSDDVDWTAASINMPLQPGDRIYTGNDGRAEIEFDDGSVYRLAEKTDVEILSLNDDMIQIQVLVGLSTLTVRSGISYEVDTPAAAFSTLRKGVYRFDVVENGNTDAIVRKGLLEAANDHITQKVDSGELIHVIPGDAGSPALSRYDRRDEWDDWNDRRNADRLAYDSHKYLPDNVYMGVSDLDAYGHWVTVDVYGPAWVPYSIDPLWSPYWVGRWCYRPFWGWTWVSYEPWGWLPYHYGRWHHSLSFGWCWLPGPAFGFNFWSPGLVRFYNGPGWVSWCPLGPYDYYNVNNFFFNRGYSYQLNNLRALQTRGPNDLINRSAVGAFRTVQRDQFIAGSFGGRDRVDQLSYIDQPWTRGQMVTDRLAIQPTARSYAPAPDRPVMRPAAEPSLPVVVRSEPSVRTMPQDRVQRITNPNVAPLPSAGGSGSPPVTEPGRRQTSPIPSSGEERSMPQPPINAGRAPGRVYQAPQTAAPQGQRSYSPPPASNDVSRSRGRDNPNNAPMVRPDSNPPRQKESPAPAPQRIERPAAPERKQDPDRPRPESRPRPNGADTARIDSSRSNWAAYSNPPRAPETVRSERSYAQPRSNPAWRQPESPAYAAPSYSRGGGYAAPSFPQGNWSSAPAPSYSAPPVNRGGGFSGGGVAHSAPSRAPSGGSGGGNHGGH
jgi:hypothetical protein